jgi:ketopantoate reductase
MKVLIVGAGVIGSFNAARMSDAGRDVTLLARGRRLADLREHGVALEDSAQDAAPLRRFLWWKVSNLYRIPIQ